MRIAAPCLALAMAATVLCSCTIKQVEAKNRTITVSGGGQVTVRCDTVTIVLATVTRNWDVGRATSENAARMAKVQEALTNAGLTADSFSTNGYAITQERTYQGDHIVYGQYRVSNEVKIQLGDVARAGEIIDIAVKAGANELTSLSYSVSKLDDAVRESRLLAVKQAEENANLLASASGAVLGKLVSLSDTTVNTFPRKQGNAKISALGIEAAMDSTPLSAHSKTVTVTIQAVYELQ
ncbi:MAG: SIMPL domain-containing protein [Treponema sp.]|nr:SIMPL domain-containing protein [Treponema sp.]